MRDIRLNLEPTDWEESWLIKCVSASNLLSLSLRENAFFAQLRERGMQVHRLRLDASTRPHPDSLPPEFVGSLVAPFYAQALNFLSGAADWLILIESLMSAKPWWTAFLRMRSVKVWAFERPPANRFLVEVTRQNLSRILHYLWGDGTEIYLVPLAEKHSPMLLRIFDRDISPARVQRFLQELPLLVGIFRDATVFEIVSNHATEVLQMQMRLEVVNLALQKRVAKCLTLLDNLQQTHPTLEQTVFAQLDTYLMRRRGLLCSLTTTAVVEREVVAGLSLGQNRFNLLLRYEYAGAICWLLARLRLKQGMVSLKRVFPLGVWIQSL